MKIKMAAAGLACLLALSAAVAAPIDKSLEIDPGQCTGITAIPMQLAWVI